MSVQKGEGRGRRILVVDDDRENVELLTEYISKEGHSVTSAGDAESALHRVRAWKPHVILLDINMPGISGLELIPRIRQVTVDDYSSIILISANMTVEDVVRGLDAGADDYLTKPFRAQELISRLRAMLRLKELQDSLRRSNHRIEELSATDELTGLMNMRALYRKADEEILRCRRFRKPISALIVDVDQFSTVNENAEFLFGSHVLRDLGGKIKSCLRSMDLIARVGADEFFVLLLETDLAGAEFVAERIRDAIQGHDFRHDKHAAKVTACIGIAGFTQDHTEGGMADLFRNVSEALRSAKVGGPNRIEIYSFV